MSRLGAFVASALGALVLVGSVSAKAGLVAWFHSPSGNIQCEVASGDSRGTYAYCQTFAPLQTATLMQDGRTKVCTRRACPVGNGPVNARTLGYGHSILIGFFRCSSARSGVRCVVAASRHGFTIAREGIKTF